MKKNIPVIFISLLIFISTCGIAHATMNYTLLESFPGFFTAGSTGPDLPTMILAIYKFGIWTVGIAGLFMLVIGGFWYMTSAGNTSTAETAKTIIWDSLLGIVAALAAYLIMYVINPDLTKISISFISVSTTTSTTSTSTGTTTAATPSSATQVSSCSEIPSQVSSQCSDASSQLSDLLVCINNKLPGKVQISSISDGNGGVNCYVNNPSWGQCSSSGGSSCCYHKQGSCHYGGSSCAGASYAADFSASGSSASIDEINSAASGCGATYTLDESNHAHVSVGSSCGCN